MVRYERKADAPVENEFTIFDLNSNNRIYG